MQDLSNKDSDQSSVHSTSHGVINCPSWWNSTGSHIPQSSLSTGLKLNGHPSQHCSQMNPLGLQVQDQDSSSTQSTSHSHQDMLLMSGGNLHGRAISVQSDNNETDGKRIKESNKLVPTLGAPDFAFPMSQIDYNQSSIACIPYPYADPYGVRATYGPQAAIHPQLMGIAHARVPLPHDVMEDEPIYVNAKQYRTILKRRELRAKLEAQNKLIKARKPYLHESRHKHAMNRVRGSGGRFLKTKSMNQSDNHAKGQNGSESEGLQSENGDRYTLSTTTTTSCSDITSVSNDNGNVFSQAGLRLSSFHSHVGGGGGGGGVIMQNGSHHRVSVIR
ncbi:Nuclear transcription factor Y subunit A-3 [Acorus gramineus]|uniref:Nuclear transcription factor Y subunit n=1 Tax=Acorus gramineus TaxID=55184 RepID=A0AAV9BYD3_ACOGR|nr:Nuclear transcription factor Y subunit A-3 [Acorus gramineus]